MKKPIIKKWNIPEIKIYLGIVFVLSLIVLHFDWRIGILALLLFFYLLYYNSKAIDRHRREWVKYIETLSANIDWATKNAIFSISIPLVMSELDGTIVWHNEGFADIIGKEEAIIEKNIADYIPNLNVKDVLQDKKKDSIEVTLDDKVYKVTWTHIKIDEEIGDNKIILLFYWQDVTEQVHLEQKYNKRKLVIAYVQVDNYDEVMAHTEESKRPLVQGEMEASLSKWASSLNASWQKYDRGEFIMAMEAQYLEKLEKNKFSILDDMKEISAGNQIPITLSIGVGVDGESPSQCAEYARSALDLALGRGGDQAVVKRGHKLFFYGGKSKAVEKRTRVKSRVIASVLRDLMEQSWEIFIMSHRFPDLDSMGAALGIYRCARHIGKDVFIVLDESNPSVHYLMQKLMEDEEYEGVFITSREAQDRIDSQSLLVVVDTHRPSFTEAPKLISMAEKIVVIDHHRRSAESIENATLTYLEPYASSASELVTEIVQYFDDKIKLKPIEANAMLAGMTMDTKSFTFKTGVRTFEAASYLRRSGADPTSVRQLFQDDMETFIARAEAVKNAEMVLPGIVFSKCPRGIKNPSLIAAQAADELLTIHGINTSFVLAEVDDDVIISGRSLGDINVQIILEKLGGGGHMSIAGARLEDISLEEASDALLQAVTEYLEEGEDK